MVRFGLTGVSALAEELRHIRLRVDDGSLARAVAVPLYRDLAAPILDRLEVGAILCFMHGHARRDAMQGEGYVFQWLLRWCLAVPIGPITVRPLLTVCRSFLFNQIGFSCAPIGAPVVKRGVGD